MSKLTVLLTGAAGFIGCHTAKKLIDEGFNVIGLDNFNDYYDPQLKKNRIKTFLRDYKFKIYKYNISDLSKIEKIFKENKIDYVCHLAAQAGVRYSLENPFIYETTNVQGTLNLLEVSKRNNLKGFIFASSSSVYGGNKKMPFSETDNTDIPISLYAATKKSTELIAYSYSHLYKLHCTGIRFFTAYGPWGRPDMALFKFAKNIVENKAIDIYGNGNMLRDFTYVDDIVDGIVRCIKKNYAYEIFNLGFGNPVKLTKYISLIEDYIGKKAIRNYMPMQMGDVRKTYAKIDKAKKKLGWKPKTPVETGVKNFLDWYFEYFKIKKCR